MALPKPYAELVAEFGDAPNARLLAAAKYGSEAQYVQFYELEGGGRSRAWNIAMNDPSWNGAGGDTVDPNTHD